MSKTNQVPQKKSPINSSVLLGLIVLIAALVLLFFYSKMDSNKPELPPKKVEKKELVFTDFKQNVFSEGCEKDLLQEIGVCDSLNQNPNLQPCSPELFKFFKLNQKKSLRDGFILLVNGRLYKDLNTEFASRRILIYEREGGRLVGVNKIKGNIIETRTRDNSDYKDLIIRFRLPEYNEAYHCLYQWNKGRYEFKICEELYSDFCKGKVKAELVDSVSIEVKKILSDEGLVN